MAWKQWIKLSAVVSAMVVLSACSTTKKNNQDANVDDANAAYSAEASGLGQDSQFGEHGRVANGAKNTYYFDFDSNQVHEDDRAAILAEGDYLAAHPNARVLLEGHTDPRGSREYNIALGERRARAVSDILAEKGVHSDQVRVVSYGAQKRAENGSGEDAYRLDRRVVLVYLKK